MIALAVETRGYFGGLGTAGENSVSRRALLFERRLGGPFGAVCGGEGPRGLWGLWGLGDASVEACPWRSGGERTGERVSYSS